MRRQLIITTCLCLSLALPLPLNHAANSQKLDQHLKERVTRGERQRIPVIIRTKSSPSDLDIKSLEDHRGSLKKTFWAINAISAEIDVSQLESLSATPGVEGISEDSLVRPFNDITVKTVGADLVQFQYGVSGRGIGVAVLDTGVSRYGGDLQGKGNGKSRVIAQWSTVGEKGNAFVNSGSTDDFFGHGTHVAGIIAGNGNESDGLLSGIAPKAQIINVKVLSDDGSGYVSDVIEGIQWVIQNKSRYNIKIINLSLGHPVFESYTTDPLTQACETAVRAGVVVVVAAGNYGKDEFGNIAYGGITSPGNDPMVITVGATKSQSTQKRSDDSVADYSSRGPTRFDLQAKPDIVAPGNRIKSIADPSSNKNDLFDLYPQNRVDPAYYGEKGDGVGKIHYFTLSGTSMAAPVVSGTAALMLEANPSLSPNLVKAILMVTAQDIRLPFIVQGAGYLNSYGAVMLAKDIKTSEVPLGFSQLMDNGFALNTQNQIQNENIVWGGNLLWGSTIVWGGNIENNQIAWGNNLLWGSDVQWESNSYWSSTVIWGGNLLWGSNYKGMSGITSVDPVQSLNLVWGSNLLWGSSTLTSNAILITGEN